MKTISLDTTLSITYDSLIIASGTSFDSPLWSISGGSARLREAVRNLHNRLPSAQSILVAGGGPAGTETAGELGEVYGKQKEIQIFSGADQLLSRLQSKKVGRDAQARLEMMGVKVIRGVRVSGDKSDGEKQVPTLSHGMTKIVDVYIEATGDNPNSYFVPLEWLDAKNKVRTDPQTLRLEVAGVKDVYCIGSVASYSDGSVLDTKFALKAVLTSIDMDLAGQGKPPLWTAVLLAWVDLRFRAQTADEEHLQEDLERHEAHSHRTAARGWCSLWREDTQLCGQIRQEQGLHDRECYQARRQDSIVARYSSTHF